MRNRLVKSGSQSFGYSHIIELSQWSIKNKHKSSGARRLVE